MYPGDSVDAPLEVLADLAYGSGQARAELVEAGHEALSKPIPLRPAVPGGFTLDDVNVEQAAGTIICPNGLTRTLTRTHHAVFGAECGS